jgi:hypothetical protein
MAVSVRRHVVLCVYIQILLIVENWRQFPLDVPMLKFGQRLKAQKPPSSFESGGSPSHPSPLRIRVELPMTETSYIWRDRQDGL